MLHAGPAPQAFIIAMLLNVNKLATERSGFTVLYGKILLVLHYILHFQDCTKSSW
jgi:hypothetical protein